MPRLECPKCQEELDEITRRLFCRSLPKMQNGTCDFLEIMIWSKSSKEERRLVLFTDAI